MPIKPADRACRSVFRHLSLPQRSRLVLGADLNCSESRRAAARPDPESEGGLPPKADLQSARLERQLSAVSAHSARAGPAPKGGSYYRMPDLRWLCEVVHTWGRNTRGTLLVRGLTISGAMSDADDVQRCDLATSPDAMKGSVSATGPIRAMPFVVPTQTAVRDSESSA